MIKPSLCAALALILAGCASDPAPSEQLRLTEQTLTQVRALNISAEQSGGLKLAEEKFAAAQTAMTQGKHREARMLAEQAELDARLAEAEQMHHASQEQLHVLQGNIQQLRKQLGALQ